MNSEISLSDTINQIRINTEIVVTKLEQVNDNIEKLEASVEHLHLSLSEQDRRLTVVEQLIPQNLIQDMAVIKQTQSAINKLIWLLGGVTLTTFVETLYHLLTK